MIDKLHGWMLSTKPLYIGLVLSIICLLGAYRIVTYYHLTHMGLVYAVFTFGIVQALLQFIFFMDLGLEDRPYWNIIMFSFTVLILFIVVGGTLWIMSNLSYNLMPSH